MLHIKNLYKTARDHDAALYLGLLLFLKLLLFSRLTMYGREMEYLSGYWVTIPGTALLVLGLSSLLKVRARMYFWLLLEVSLNLLMLLDFWHSRYFQSPTSVYSLLQMGNLQGLEGSILGIIRASDFLLLLDLPLALWLIMRIRQKAMPPVQTKLAGLLLLAGTLLFVLKPADRMLQHKGIFSSWDRLEDLVNYNVLGFHVVDSVRAVFFSTRLKLDAGQKKSIRSWYKRHMALRQTIDAAADKTSGKKKLNLIIVQVESLPEIVMEQGPLSQELVPNLMRIAGESLHFTNVHAQNRSGGTSDAELMVISGLLPVQEGSTFFRFADDDYPSIFKLLGRQRYHVAAFHGNRASYWNRASIYPHFGVRKFYDLQTFKNLPRTEMGVGDAGFFAKSIEIINKIPQPMACYLITLDAHVGRITDSAEPYLRSLKRSDAAIGAFYDGLKRAGLLDTSLVVFFGDHPPFIRPEVLRQHADQRWLGDAARRIPLIMHVPGTVAKTISTHGGHVDILPTILQLLGQPPAALPLCVGRSLLDPRYDFAALPRNKFYAADKTPLQLRNEAVDAFRVSDMMIRSNDFSAVQAVLAAPPQASLPGR